MTAPHVQVIHAIIFDVAVHLAAVFVLTG